MIHKLLHRRIFPGFTVGEALAWLCFHISWAMALGGLYYFTGQFDLPDFLSSKEFVYTQLYVLLIKAIFILPFWWLYFVRLRAARMLTKLLLHLFTGPLFTLLCVGSIYTIKHELLKGNYPFRAVIGDIYATWIFYYSHFAVFHAYNFWLDTRRRMKREQELKDLAHESQISALKSQIQPHFLFNTLNSISASVPRENESTRVLIAQLADTFRYGLSITQRNTVTLQEELDFIKTWLSLEKIRFKDRLNIIYHTDLSILQVQVPPMILQPLVENALAHGIGPKVEGGTVTIACRREEAFARISISDTGVGYKGNTNHMASEGIGLSNVCHRLQLLYNVRVEVNRNDEGLCVSFKIPLAR